MVLCEQFIFTSADLEDKSGYQVISQSSNITQQLLDELENYFIPAGLDPSKFLESKSMLVMENKIVFTKAKNIGIGYDGRPDTLYSHTILMSIEDFKKFQFDSRIFDHYFLLKKESEHLAPLVIEPTKSVLDFSCVDVLGMAQIKDFLIALFDRRNIAILNTEHKELVQSLLSISPPSLRLISFSNLVLQPQRQSKYELIQTQSSKSSLKEFVTIDPQEREIIYALEDSLFEQCISYQMELIDSKNSLKLMEIYNEVDTIPLESYKEKFSLIIGTNLLDPKHPLLLDQKSIYDLLTILDKLPPPIASKYFPKIEPYIKEEDAIKISRKIEDSEIIYNYKKTPLTYDGIVKMFGEQSNGTSESRISLFDQLVKDRKADFKSSGSKILIESAEDFYNKDVIQGFVTNSVLEQCIYDALKSVQIKINVRNSLFTMIAQAFLHHNPKLLEKLFSIKLHDLNDYNDAYSLKNTIKDLFEDSKFHIDLQPKIVFFIIKQIHDRIVPEFPRNKKSGIVEDRHYDIQDILIALLNMLRYLLTRRKHMLKEVKPQIQELESSLTKFLNLNRLPTKHSSMYNLFALPFTLSWNLFSGQKN